MFTAAKLTRQRQIDLCGLCHAGAEAELKRPAFTFNLDAVQDFVVVSDGANAEFGRSGGGFVNIITKSGTNEFHGSAHYFGKYDALSADFSHSFPGGVTSGFTPDFAQHQFGATLGGPLVRDKAFFFLAYDQQEYNETKQTDRLGAIDPALIALTDTAFGGALQGDFGAIRRTNDANAFLAKLDFKLGQAHTASLKYNYTNSRQENGTFDVDFWARSANALERDFSHAVNGSVTSLFSSALSNEFRFQWAREDRPRPYEGPANPGTGRPFPDTDIASLATGFGADGLDDDVAEPGEAVLEVTEREEAQILAEAGKPLEVGFVPQTHPPAVEAEVDFGEFTASIAGQVMKLYMF